MSFLPISAEDWVCPSCGGYSELMGEIGTRKLAAPQVRRLRRAVSVGGRCGIFASVRGCGQDLPMTT
jgi:hypothetical protein